MLSSEAQTGRTPVPKDATLDRAFQYKEATLEFLQYWPYKDGTLANFLGSLSWTFLVFDLVSIVEHFTRPAPVVHELLTGVYLQSDFILEPIMYLCTVF